MNKEKIKTDPSRCAECLSCQLRCSLAYDGAFNPEKARIVIDPLVIEFTDECLAGCILCTKYCVYGAITVVTSS